MAGIGDLRATLTEHTPGGRPPPTTILYRLHTDQARQAVAGASGAAVTRLVYQDEADFEGLPVDAQEIVAVKPPPRPDLTEQLRSVVDALDRGDLTAGPLARAHLAGALDATDALDAQQKQPEPDL